MVTDSLLEHRTHLVPPGTNLEAAPILLDEVVVHCAHRPPVLIQHFRLPMGTRTQQGLNKVPPWDSPGTPPQDPFRLGLTGGLCVGLPSR